MQSFIIVIVLSLVSASPAPQGLGLLNSLSSGSTSDVASGNNGLSSGLASGSTSDLSSSVGQSSKSKGIETGFGLGTDSLLNSNSQDRGVLSSLLGQKRANNPGGLGSNFGSSNAAQGISQLGLNSGNPRASPLRTISRPNNFQNKGPSNGVDLNGNIRKGSRHGSLKNRLVGRPHGIKFHSFEPINEQTHHRARHGSRKNSFEPHHEDSDDEDFSDDEQDYYYDDQPRSGHHQKEGFYIVEEDY